MVLASVEVKQTFECIEGKTKVVQCTEQKDPKFVQYTEQKSTKIVQ